MTSPLIVDVYALDVGGHPNIKKLLDAGPPWHGIILKATEGTYYPGSTARKAWFLQNWLPARILAMERYGQDWFRGAYHYLRIDQDIQKQVDMYLDLIQLAGGWGPGDLPPCVDLEQANNPPNASAQQVIDATTKWAEAIKKEIGKAPILYGGSYIRDRHIKDQMGCQLLWTARYSATLPSITYTDMGWPLEKLFAWQYCGGKNTAHLANYPTTSPIGDTDISVVTLGGGGESSIASIRALLSDGTPSQV